MMDLKSVIKDCQAVIDNIFKKIRNERKIEISDIAVLGLLISQRNIAGSVKTLFENSNYSEIPILYRTFLEQEIYLIFIFEKNTIERAKVFFLHEKYLEVIKSEKALESLREDSQDALKLRNLRKLVDEEVKEDISDFNNFDEMYKNYCEQYEKYFTGMKKETIKKKKWYSFEDKKVSNMRELMKSLGRGKLYDGIYGLPSDVVHGSTAPGILKLVDVDKEKKIANVAESVPKFEWILRNIRSALYLELPEFIKFYKIDKDKDMRLLEVKIKINTSLKH